MGIERGRDWGWPGTLPEGAAVLSSDLELHVAVQRVLECDAPLVVGLLGGSLWRTLGGGTDVARWRCGPATVLPVDLVRARIDDRDVVAAAHLVARRRTWLGPVLGIMNAAHLGSWNPAPRAHPGDGRVDVIEARLPVGDVWAARRRLPAGSHVPHPAISVRQAEEATFTLGRRCRVWVDGWSFGPATELTVEVLPGALHVVV